MRLLLQKPRRGGVSWPLVMIVGSLGLLSVLIASLVLMSPVAVPAPGAIPVGKPAAAPLTVYCAASNRAVMEAVRKDYEAEFGIEVQVQYGASQSLLAAIDVTKTGDLYLPADDSFFIAARERKLIEAEFPLADMHAVVAVPKGNPRGITTLNDLLQEDVRLAQGITEATGIGVVTRAALTKSGHWDAVQKQTMVFKTTVNEVANDVKIGAVDAGIVYDVVLHTYDTLEAVVIPELSGIQSRVTVATLTTSPQPRQARHFARYLSARDKGLKRYTEYGFRPVRGDLWMEQAGKHD
jgi:molybdate transport system substrate-binding protein